MHLGYCLIFPWLFLYFNFSFSFIYSVSCLSVEMLIRQRQNVQTRGYIRHKHCMATLHSKQTFPLVVPHVALAPARRYENPSSAKGFPLKPSGATLRCRSQLSVNQKARQQITSTLTVTTRATFKLSDLSCVSNCHIMCSFCGSNLTSARTVHWMCPLWFPLTFVQDD